MNRKFYLLHYATLIVLAGFVFFPFYWGLRTSLAPANDFHFFPTTITAAHYQALLQRPEFWQYTQNSLLVAFGTIGMILLITPIGSYALARFRFLGEKFGILFLLLPLLPPIAILVPLLAYFNKIGLNDSLLAVIIANTVFNLPFVVWMLRNFILTNPVEIEEAALLDGCSRLRVLFQIVLPTLLPGLIAVIVFVFINAWNNYLYAFALTSSHHLRVLPQGILAFLGSWGTYCGGLTAAGMLAIIPPVLLFLIFQRWFIQGILGEGKR
jgi:ABC-type glycerol-3-phosphate transport system permease component